MGNVVTLAGEPYRLSGQRSPNLVVHPAWEQGKGLTGWRVTVIGVVGCDGFAREYDFPSLGEATDFALTHANYRGWRWTPYTGRVPGEAAA